MVNFTKRELEVIKLVIGGNNNREMAQKLSISELTVSTHLKHIFEKVGCKNRVQLAVWVINNKII